MPLLGLIGNPIGHSRSPEIFAGFFRHEGLTDWNYELFPLTDIAELPALIEKQPNLRGLNVTIPFKTSIIPLLDNISAEAEEIGAVNTVKIIYQNGKIILSGLNTDVYGFEKLLHNSGAQKTDAALVLGSGGAAKAVCYVLRSKKIPYQLVSRNPQTGELGYNDLTETIIASHSLIINTTPLGMHPRTAEYPPIPFDFIDSKHTVIDLIYNPETTELMQKAMKQGATAFNGLLMLQKQAEKAWEIFKKEK